MKSLTRKDDFICGICRDILYKPITTLCGHNYCMKCYNDKKECPLCRNTQISDRIDYNRLLDSIIQEKFPFEYKIRHEYFINVEEIKILKQKYLTSERRKLILKTLAEDWKGHYYICFTFTLDKIRNILYDKTIDYNNLRYEVYHAWIEFMGDRRIIGPYVLPNDGLPSMNVDWNSHPNIYMYAGILYMLTDHKLKEFHGKDELKSRLIDYEKHCGIDNTDLWNFDSNPELCLDEFIKSNREVLRK
jgi:hypothetical protein